jgi:hypothetical protein
MSSRTGSLFSEDLLARSPREWSLPDIYTTPKITPEGSRDDGGFILRVKTQV